jgi:hypothetical protein
MKKEQLKQIIKEELQAMLNEMDYKSPECKDLHDDYKDAKFDGYANPGGYAEAGMASAVAKAKGKGCKWHLNL